MAAFFAKVTARDGTHSHSVDRGGRNAYTTMVLSGRNTQVRIETDRPSLDGVPLVPGKRYKLIIKEA